MKAIASIALLVTSVSLTACGGNSNAQTTQSPSGPEISAGSQVRALEAAGRLPTLDRSDSLAGPDVNGNGVRDDIDQWISQQDGTAPQKQAMTQSAQALQHMLLVDLRDDAALQAAAEASADAVACMYDQFPDPQTPSIIGNRIEAFTANTEQRARRYMAYNARRGGTTTRMLNTNTCK